MFYHFFFQAFQIFDFDRDGQIDKEDLRKSMIAMGQDVHEIKEEELDKMMSEVLQPTLISLAYIYHLFNISPPSTIFPPCLCHLSTISLSSFKTVSLIFLLSHFHVSIISLQYICTICSPSLYHP